MNKLYCECFHIKSKNYSLNSLEKPWITPAIKVSIRKKSHYFKLYKAGIISLESRNRYRNQLNRVITSSRSEYYRKRFEDNQNDAKKTWNLINRITNRNNRKQTVKKLMNNDTIVTDNHEIGSIFNNFFTSIGSDLSNALPPSDVRFETYLDSPCVRSFFFFQVTPSECEKIISSLKNSKTDINSIPVSLFKRISPYISGPLSNLINFSYEKGIFPKCLKISKVTPVFKSGDPLSTNNYRPISVFGFYTKIFEKCLVNRMLKYLTKFNLICPQQFGFLKGKSTFHAVNSIIEFIYDSFNRKQNCISIFLDLKKAFDTVNHSILLKKLEYYGFRCNSLKWFKSYLHDRQQVVKIGNSLSNPSCIDIGVPQGSTLGPILFLIYINDIIKSSDKFNFSMFADDTALSLKGKNPDQLIRIANEELKNVSKWLLANRLTLNYNKTQWMFFTSSVKEYVFESDCIKIDNMVISRCFEFKYLGIILDSKLKFDKHIDYIGKKISRSIGIFYRLRNLIPIKGMLALYYSLVYPYIIYCILIWGNTYQTHLNKIILLQKRIIRIVNNASYLAHTSILFHQMRVLKFSDVFKFFLGKYAYEQNISNNLNFVSHDYPTSSSSNPVPQFQRLTSTQRSLNYLAPVLFNQIDDSIKRVQSTQVFKSRYKQFLLSDYIN